VSGEFSSQPPRRNLGFHSDVHFDEPLAPVPDIGIIVDQLLARFHECDGRGAEERNAALAEDFFERVKKIGWRCHVGLVGVLFSGASS
jgi:hypothetical protein